jgi:hypothetical protein
MPVTIHDTVLYTIIVAYLFLPIFLADNYQGLFLLG